jgi:hypothetical protein
MVPAVPLPPTGNKRLNRIAEKHGRSDADRRPDCPEPIRLVLGYVEEMMSTKALLLILVSAIVASPVARTASSPPAQTQKETNTNCTKILAESPWEGNTQAHLNSYKHILVISVFEDHWEDRGPTRYSLHHYSATVTKAYKGDWKTGERIAIVHAVDSPAIATANASAGQMVFVFTNAHTVSEIALETGEFGNFIPYIERILQCVFP